MGDRDGDWGCRSIDLGDVMSRKNIAAIAPAAVAGLLVTTEAMVAEKSEEGTSSTPGGMGGAL